MRSRLAIVGCLALLFGLYLPFLHQAYHIDDPFFLALANHLLTDWAHPYAFAYNWYLTPEPVFTTMVNPPLHPYFLAAIIAVWGQAEWVVHLVSFLFVIGAFLGMYRLARRFETDPLAAACLLVCAPAALVMSHTCMPDMALLACTVAAVASFITGLDRLSWRWLTVGGLLAGAASLVRYSGLGVSLVCLGYVILTAGRDRRRWLAGGLALAIPAAIIGIWSVISWAHYGHVHLLTSLEFMRRAELPVSPSLNVLLRLAAVLHYIGGTTVFPLCVLWFYAGQGRAGWRRLGVAAILSGLGALWTRQFCGYAPSQALLSWGMLLAAFVMAGELIVKPVWTVVRSRSLTPRQAVDLFFIFWVLVFFLPTLPSYFPAVKRLLPLLPPLLLLFLRRLETAETACLRRWKQPALAGTVVLTLLLGLGVSWADYQQAEVYRSFAGRLVREARSPHGTTWCAGHWGFQYYMERAGLISFDLQRDRVQPGDHVLLAIQPWPQISAGPIAHLARLPSGTTYPVEGGTLTLFIPPRPAWPIRTVCWWGGAHFYAYLHYPNVITFLPYSVSNAPQEVFLLYRSSPTVPAHRRAGVS